MPTPRLDLRNCLALHRLSSLRKMNLVLLLFLAMSLPSHTEKISCKIYHKLSAIKFCFRRLNATHQLGCATSGSSTGVVHLVKTQKDIECLGSATESTIVAMSLSFLSTDNMVILRDSERVNGVLVLQSPRDPIPPRFSEDSSCPNQNFGLYTDTLNENYSRCKMGDWNPPNPGLSLMYVDWKMPIFLITNQTDIDFIRKECYENFNGPNSRSTENSPKCAAQLKLNMYAAKDTPTCMRRSSFINEISPVRYCEPLSDWNIVGMLFAVNKSCDIEPRSVLVVGARLDASSMFYNLAPGAHTTITGLVTFLTVAYTLAYLREDLKSKIKPPFSNVLFLIFNGEAFDYIGSSRVVFDMNKGVFPVIPNDDIDDQSAPVNLHHISHFIEIGQMGVRNSTLFIHTDPVTTRDPSVGTNVQDVIDNLQNLSQGWNIRRSPRDHPLPPSSLQMFLREDPEIAGVVLADHEASFINPHYNSFLDTKSDLVDRLPSDLANVSTILSQAIYRLLTGSERPDIKVNASIVKELLTCFLVDRCCPLMKELLGENECPQNRGPYSLYICVEAHRRRINAITIFTRHIFAYLFGDPLEDISQEACKNNGSQLYYHDWIPGSKTSGFCSRSTVTYTLAISPAFVLENWTSGLYSTWTESVWTEPRLRFFLRPSRHQELYTLIFGVLILFCSFCITEFIRKNFINIFVFYERQP